MPRRSIAGRFQALLTSLFGVLFSFRSLYYCAIGLEICLALEECVPQFPARYPTHGTQEQATSSSASHTGLSPSTAPRSRGIVLAEVGLKGRLTTPHLLALSGRIRFRLCWFHSPLLAASLLVSSPAPTQMFQLGAFPTPTGRMGSSHSEIPGSEAPCASPGLIAAWRVLHRSSSQAIHRTAQQHQNTRIYSALRTPRGSKCIVMHTRHYYRGGTILFYCTALYFGHCDILPTILILNRL